MVKFAAKLITLVVDLYVKRFTGIVFNSLPHNPDF